MKTLIGLAAASTLAFATAVFAQESPKPEAKQPEAGHRHQAGKHEHQAGEKQQHRHGRGGQAMRGGCHEGQGAEHKHQS